MGFVRNQFNENFYMKSNQSKTSPRLQIQPIFCKMGKVIQHAPNAGSIHNLIYITHIEHRSAHLTRINPIQLADIWPRSDQFRVLRLCLKKAQNTKILNRCTILGEF